MYISCASQNATFYVQLRYSSYIEIGDGVSNVAIEDSFA
jgi:hypothetical protein